MSRLIHKLDASSFDYRRGDFGYHSVCGISENLFHLDEKAHKRWHEVNCFDCLKEKGKLNSKVGQIVFKRKEVVK